MKHSWRKINKGDSFLGDSIEWNLVGKRCPVWLSGLGQNHFEEDVEVLVVKGVLDVFGNGCGQI